MVLIACNTGKHGMRPARGAFVRGQRGKGRVGEWERGFGNGTYVRTSNRWRYLDRLSSAQTVVEHRGQQTVQYDITIQATATSHRRRYNAVTAQHINRGALLPPPSLPLPLFLSLFASLLFHRCPSTDIRTPFSSPGLFVPVRSERRLASARPRPTISDWPDH